MDTIYSMSPELCAFFGYVEGTVMCFRQIITLYEAQVRSMGYQPYDETLLKNKEITALLNLKQSVNTASVLLGLRANLCLRA